MSVLRLNIIVDMKPLLDVYRYSEKNQPTITRVAAQRYLRYLRQRFIAQSASGGGWEELKKETKERKARRGVAPNPNWILREYGYLLKSFGIRNKGKFTYVGVTKDIPHPRGNSTVQIATIHQFGEGNVPERTVMPLRIENIQRKRMVDDIRKEYDKIIRANRRKK